MAPAGSITAFEASCVEVVNEGMAGIAIVTPFGSGLRISKLLHLVYYLFNNSSYSVSTFDAYIIVCTINIPK